LYEGARVNVDHPERTKPGSSRSYRDRFGSFKNVRFVEGDGLRGDFKYNKKHSVAEQFEYDVENDPENCGFSHNATGPLVKRGGSLVCESIEAVRSVDLVADAATTASLFEGKPRMKIRRTAKTRKTKFSRKEIGKRLMEGGLRRRTIRRLLEALDPNAPAPAAAPSGGAGGGDSVDAILALIKPILQNPNLSQEDSIKQTTKVMKALKDMIPGGSSKDAAAAGTAADMMAGDDDDADADDDDRIEGDDVDDDDDPPRNGKKPKAGKKDRGQDLPATRLEARLARLEAREERTAVNELCSSEGFKPTEKQLKLLLAAEDDETRQDLIESWTDADDSPARTGRIRGKGRAKSREFVEGGSGGKARKYKDSADWAADLIDD
jgi:hypothetical protein